MHRGRTVRTDLRGLCRAVLGRYCFGFQLTVPTRRKAIHSSNPFDRSRTSFAPNAIGFAVRDRWLWVRETADRDLRAVSEFAGKASEVARSQFPPGFQAGMRLLFHLHGFATSIIAIPLAFLPFV